MNNMKGISRKVVVLIIACILIVATIIAYYCYNLQRQTSSEAEPPALRSLTGEEKERVRNLIEGARQEGRLVWYGINIYQEYAPGIETAFREYYGLPNFVIEYTYTSASELMTRVEQEISAGSVTVDVIWTGTYHWLVSLRNRGLLMYYESPNYKYYNASETLGMNSRGYWVADAYTLSTPVINLDALKQKIGWTEIPEFVSYWSFIRPEFRGLVMCPDVARSETNAFVFAVLYEKLGRSYFEQIRDVLNPIFLVKSGDFLGYLETGDYPIALPNNPKLKELLENRGINAAAIFPAEGVVWIPFCLTAMKDAPHPNAAKLFIDFMRSEVGLNAILDQGVCLAPGHENVESPRPDIYPNLKDIRGIQVNYEEFYTIENIQHYINIWREIFGR
ncbi:MAG: extracellular solute-binding protein [Candidatus Bathyarchaeia archaeon]